MIGLNPDLQKIILKVSARRVVERRDRLLHDLGIAGDDALELLETIHDRFGTSFAEMPFVDFLPYETDALWCHWVMRLGFKSDKRELTIDHLAKVIDRCVWFEP